MNFLNFKKGSLNNISVMKIISDFWNNNYRIFFGIFSFLSLSVGICLWYTNTYQSDWNDEKKKQYINSQNKEIEFNEEGFNDVVREIDRKKVIFDEKTGNIKNIFSSVPDAQPKNQTDKQEETTDLKNVPSRNNVSSTTLK